MYIYVCCTYFKYIYISACFRIPRSLPFLAMTTKVRGYTATFATPEMVLQQAASKGAAPKAKAKAKAAAQSPKKEVLGGLDAVEMIPCVCMLLCFVCVFFC